MADIIRDNEIRTLAKMQMIETMMKTVFPNNKNLMTEWSAVTKNIKNLVDTQESNIREQENT